MDKDKLLKIIERKNKLQKNMLENQTGDVYRKLAREYAEIRNVAEVAENIIKALSQIDELEEIVEDKDEDEEIKKLAEKEIKIIQKQINRFNELLKKHLLPKDEDDNKNIIIEIRAGTGGEEAALFAANLHEMYYKYAQIQGWKFEVISTSHSNMYGYKEVISSIKGKNVFRQMQFEAGVHRVQRVPVTETVGRIHTSVATVAVMPEVSEIEVVIDNKDIRIDFFRASGAGGQHVNKTDSAVRITHMPTQTVVVQQDEKSQHKNKAKAMRILRAKIYEKKRKDNLKKRAETIQSQIGTGDRSERVRTYNFPQARVTDHRINLTIHKLPQIMAGEGLKEVIESLIAKNELQKMAEFDQKNET